MNKVTSKVAEHLIKTMPVGTIFSVEFEKVDGTLRKMTCRSGVSKYVKGTGKPRQGKDGRTLLTVYELNTVREGADNYRCFYADKLKAFKTCGEVFVVEN